MTFFEFIARLFAFKAIRKIFRRKPIPTSHFGVTDLMDRQETDEESYPYYYDSDFDEDRQSELGLRLDELENRLDSLEEDTGLDNFLFNAKVLWAEDDEYSDDYDSNCHQPTPHSATV